ncbi:MAG: hypothetical protein J3K34DRAFT_30973 [Monoraphidium minutum]|nr:MAG: hypothetical protein J3K34DRAFT_30973 [Monoraphidium minutum]
MAPAPRRTPRWAPLLLLLLAAVGAAAQMGFGGGKNKPDLPPAVRSDIKYIKCAVCQQFVKQAVRATKTLREEIKPGKKLEESDIIDKLEGLCNAATPGGEWARTLDMVEKGDAIEIRDMGKVGRHTTETSTIARACADVSDGLDLSDLSEALYKGKTRAQLTQLACYEMSGACNKKPPAVPEDRPAGPAFAALSEGELERERMMAQMAAAGLGGQMYDRDSLKREMGDMEGLGGGGGAFGAGSDVAKRGGLAGAADAARAAAARAGPLLRSLSAKLGMGGGGAEL